ncbi:substrate-binding domain-containing protein [Guggenheimella bovis]
MKKIFLLCLMTFLLVTGCTEQTSDTKPVLSTPGAKITLSIVSGSENKELVPILEKFVKEKKVNIDINYKGSLDIMRELSATDTPYDAVWPASSMWISMGDQTHNVKHVESTSINPVVFGVKKSLAEKLGFVGKDVSIKDILKAIEDGKLRFSMTSATQSNSGASAYIGFLYGLAGSPEVLTEEHLNDPELAKNVTELLSGVNRSSGSSEWLKELFLKGGLDAMVNYESLIITTNQELEKRGEEPLYVIYPYDGLSIADSPLGYIDKGDQKKEEAFLELQAYLLSKETQDEIQKTGRRTGFTGVKPENDKIFRADWGVDTKRILSPLKMPTAKVIDEALNLYQSRFKKPSLTIYLLDFSGSMYGEGHDQLMKALEQIFIEANAKKNLLQGQPKDRNLVYLFSSSVIDEMESDGDPKNLADLYEKITTYDTGGGTDIYRPIVQALEKLKGEDLSGYQPAIILLTDGQSNQSGTLEDVKRAFEETKLTIPVFSIMFGEADKTQLDGLADLTKARVFDGRTNLIDAFRAVKGYN